MALCAIIILGVFLAGGLAIFGVFVWKMAVAFTDIEDYDYVQENSNTPPPHNPTPTPISELDYRLPFKIQPIKYKIHISSYLKESDAKKFTFEGYCAIEIQVLQNTKQIQLHMRNLNVTSSTYRKKNDFERTALPAATPHSLTDIVVYNLKEELKANEIYVLNFAYGSSINEGVNGFYRSKYTSANATKWFYGTEFEPIDARKAFPCFDEPIYKAIFSLSMSFNRPFKSMGPTAVLNKYNTEHFTHITYRDTPKMSTNALSFTLSEYNVRSDNQLSVLARPEYSSQTKYSHDCGKHLLAAFCSHFGTSLSTENHIHLVEAPKFELSESSLLYDMKESSLKWKQLVVNTVAFKLARLWMGNLVTCQWWNDVWLHEGFNYYYKYFGTDLIDSSFNMSSQFVVDVIQYAMFHDASSARRRLSNDNVRTQQDIYSMFDQVSFQKAAAFIHMTNNILEEQNFTTALKIYIKTYAYKNTIPSDLFTILASHWPSKHHGLHKNYFKTFTTQKGYPVVTFNRTSNTTVEVSQKCFLLYNFNTSNPKETYTVPITYATSLTNDFLNTSPEFFLENNTHTLNVESEVSWIIGNKQQTAYYRVNYDYNSWNAIRQKLFSESREDIHVFNRAQIVDDLFNLAYAGEISWNVTFYTFQYLKNETKYLPWAAALKGFSHLMKRLGNETNIFIPFLRQIIQPEFDRVGFETLEQDTTLDIFRRSNIMTWACKGIIPLCNYLAKVHFAEISKNRSVEANIRSVVYCAAMSTGNESYFDTLYSKYKAEPVSSEKNLILESLSCVKGTKLVDKFFQIILSNDLHVVDKTLSLYNLCSKNNENVDRVFYLIDKHIVQLVKPTDDYQPVAFVVLKIAEHFTTEAQLQKLKDFNAKHNDKFGKLTSALRRAVRIVQNNLKWSRENLGKIKSILAEIAPMTS